MVSLFRNLVFLAIAGLLLVPVARDALEEGDARRWLEAVLGVEDAPPPAAPEGPPGAPAQAVIRADRMGQYRTEARIDGVKVPVLVDTGATFVALTAEDSRRLGIVPSDGEFRHVVSTANGLARVAMTTVREIQLGGVRIRNVKAVVYRGKGLDISLLGMSFLDRLSRFEVADRRLRLVQ